MRTTLIVLGFLLGAWWLILTVIAVANYIQRVRDARTPLTPEEHADCRRLGEDLPPIRSHGRRDFLVVPFAVVFFLLLWPWFLYGLALKYRDPYDHPPKA